MEIYIHTAGREIELVEVSEDKTVEALIAEQLAEAGDAWLEDAEQPLERGQGLRAAGIGERAHVHVSKCDQVHVTVRYPGAPSPIDRDFKPNQTIARVFEWATSKKGFDLTPTEKAKHALGICDTTTEADKDEHVGTFANDECKACFDLAPKERFEG